MGKYWKYDEDFQDKIRSNIVCKHKNREKIVENLENYENLLYN